VLDLDVGTRITRLATTPGHGGMIFLITLSTRVIPKKGFSGHRSQHQMPPRTDRFERFPDALRHSHEDMFCTHNPNNDEKMGQERHLFSRQAARTVQTTEKNKRQPPHERHMTRRRLCLVTCVKYLASFWAAPFSK